MTTKTTKTLAKTLDECGLPVLPPRDCLHCERFGEACDNGCDGWMPSREWLDAMNARQPFLEAAFSAVQNPADWKAPIDYILRASTDEPLVKLICEAIEHFTATKATVTEIESQLVRIQADGYRLGPAH